MGQDTVQQDTEQDAVQQDTEQDAMQQDTVQRDVLIEAIRASWSADTSERPADWAGTNPAMGHCDVSSFVAWEHLGGDLVLGEVHLDGEFQEYHYWNRIDGVDLDLTVSQFKRGEVVSEKSVLESAYLASNHGAIRSEVAERIAAFRQAVDRQLDAV